MAKKLNGCVTFTNHSTLKLMYFKSTDRKNARVVVMRKLRLPSFTEVAFANRNILHVYLNGKLIQPIDKMTSKLEVLDDEPEIGRPSLKPKKILNGLVKNGLRQYAGLLLPVFA